MYALLVAHNADERAILVTVLQRAGLAVSTADNLDKALRIWPDRPADLIVLAIRTDNLEQIRSIRIETSVPIILISDPPDEESHYDLLENGADLVLPRPFSARLLIAQVRAMLRRAGGIPLSRLPQMDLADLKLDPATRTVTVADLSPRRLTHLEFRLLYTLMIHRGQIVPTETIVEHVWGYSGEGDKDLVRGLIRRLRTKVEPDPATPQYILTAPGVGYSLQPPD